jgi:hypothetical protein
MNKKGLIAGLAVSVNFSYAQNVDEYAKLIRKADSLYNKQEYRKSGDAYSEAFKSLGWKGTTTDRYNAACTWALANVPDSAFFNLERAARIGGYKNYQHFMSDEDLNSLHGDKRWKGLTESIKQNKEKAEANLDKLLVAKLDTIYLEDQSYRVQAMEIQRKHGTASKEFQDIWKIANEKDSINLIKIKAILDTYGWLGADVVGEQGNTTLFLVIQHADLKTQEKYLPLMRDAVKNGKAQGSSLALLEDRVEIRNGRKQIYGSQIGMDKGKYYVAPLLDPENVNKRRTSVGLNTLEEYIENWDMKWDVEQYKKDLPYLESIQQKY